MHLASPSLQAWVYQAYAGPLTPTGTQALAPSCCPAEQLRPDGGEGAGGLAARSTASTDWWRPRC
jgi:hypothetical protein